MKICSFRVLIEPDPLKKEHKFKDDEGKELKIEIAKPHEQERRERTAQTTGRIVQVGPTAWRAYDEGEPWAKVGDRVLYTRYGGKPITNPKDPDNNLMIVDDENILAVLEDDEEYNA